MLTVPQGKLGELWPAVGVALALILTAVSGAASVLLPTVFSPVPMAILLVLSVVGVASIPRLRLPRFVLAPILAFILFTIIATFISLFTANFVFAARGAMGLLGCIGTMLAVSAACASDRADVAESRRRLVVVTIAVIAIACALWALRQALVGFTPAEIEAVKAQGSTHLVGTQIRTSGLFAVNQEFGLFCTIAIPALLVLVIRETKYRWTYLSGFVLLLGALVMSLTRTPIVAAAMASLVGLILYGSGRSVLRRSVVSLIVASSVVGTGFLLMAMSNNERVQAAFARTRTLLLFWEDGSFKARTDYVWQRGTDQMSQHWFGLGAGSAGPISSRYPEAAPAGSITTDQGYIMVGVQVGWLGLAAFVWMLAVLLVWLGRSSDTKARAASMALLSLMVAMLASGYWSLAAPMVLVGALLGVGVSAATAERLGRLPSGSGGAPMGSGARPEALR